MVFPVGETGAMAEVAIDDSILYLGRRGIDTTLLDQSNVCLSLSLTRTSSGSSVRLIDNDFRVLLCITVFSSLQQSC